MYNFINAALRKEDLILRAKLDICNLKHGVDFGIVFLNYLYDVL